MRLFIFLLLALAPSFANAQLHKGSIGGRYYTSSADIIYSNTILDGDISYAEVSASYFVNDNIELSYQSSAGVWDVETLEFDFEFDAFFITLHSERVNLVEGSGGGAYLTAGRGNIDLTFQGTTTSDSDTTYGLGVTRGLGNGLSIDFQGDEDADFNLTVYSCQSESFCLKAYGDYNTAEDDGEVRLQESLGFGVGLELLF